MQPNVKSKSKELKTLRHTRLVESLLAVLKKTHSKCSTCCHNKTATNIGHLSTRFLSNLITSSTNCAHQSIMFQ